MCLQKRGGHAFCSREGLALREMGWLSHGFASRSRGNATESIRVADLTRRGARGARGARSGCASLLEEVRRVGPRLVVSGHVHAAHGVASACGTAFVNAASCGSGGDGAEGYLVEWPPVVVDL